MDALSSRVWREALAVDVTNLWSGGSLTSRSVRDINYICKGRSIMRYAPQIDADLNVEFLISRTY